MREVGTFLLFLLGTKLTAAVDALNIFATVVAQDLIQVTRTSTSPLLGIDATTSCSISKASTTSGSLWRASMRCNLRALFNLKE